MTGQGIKNTQSIALDASGNARPYADGSYLVPGIYPARVTAGDAATGYTVGLIQPDGSVSGTRVWTRVRTIPGGLTLSVDADVLLRFRSDGEFPTIVSSGSGGGGGDYKAIVTAIDTEAGTVDVDVLDWTDETTVIASLADLTLWPPGGAMVGDEGFVKYNPLGSGASFEL